MKQLSAAGVVVGLLALLLSSIALVSSPGGADDARAELETLKGSVSALRGRIDSLEAGVEAASAGPADESRTLTDLSARLEKAEAEATRLGSKVADISARPAAAAAPVDEAGLREAVQAEVRAALERRRPQAAAGRPGGNQRPDRAASLRELGLSEDKVAKVTESEQKLRDEIRRYFRENRGGDRDAARKVIDETREKANAELAKSLTPEEMEKYREWYDQQRQRGRGGRDRGNRGGGGAGGGGGGQPQDGAAF